MILTILIVSVILNVVAVFTTFNLLKKTEVYEDAVQQFYSAVSLTLHNMRALDERRMFETDDEVGTVFEQLTGVVNELRPLLYGNPDEQLRRTEEE